MPPIETNESGDDLRATLEAAFDEGAPVPTGAEPITPSTGVDAPADVVDKTPASAGTPAPVVATDGDERPRGPDGKFIPKDAAASTTAKPAATATDKPAAPVTAAAPKLPSTDSTTKASDAQPSTAAVAPPVGWTADAKAEWDSLSPAIKAAVLKREVEISSGGRQWSEEKRRYEAIVAPVRPAASQLGISEAEAVQRLMLAHDRLRENAPAAIQWLAQAYRVPITVNGQHPSSSSANGSPAADGSSRTESQFDPSQFLAPVNHRLDAIQARLAAEDQRQTDTLVQSVQAFAADPAHPHFDAVQEELLAMLPLLKARSPHAAPEQLLQDAYDRALYANTETRAAVEAQRMADADAKRRADNSAAVAKAKLASTSVRGTPPAGGPAVAPKDSIREELEAAFAAR